MRIAVLVSAMWVVVLLAIYTREKQKLPAPPAPTVCETSPTFRSAKAPPVPKVKTADLDGDWRVVDTDPEVRFEFQAYGNQHYFQWLHKPDDNEYRVMKSYGWFLVHDERLIMTVRWRTNDVKLSANGDLSYKIAILDANTIELSGCSEKLLLKKIPIPKE